MKLTDLVPRPFKNLLIWLLSLGSPGIYSWISAGSFAFIAKLFSKGAAV